MLIAGQVRTAWQQGGVYTWLELRWLARRTTQLGPQCSHLRDEHGQLFSHIRLLAFLARDVLDEPRSQRGRHNAKERDPAQHQPNAHDTARTRGREAIPV